MFKCYIKFPRNVNLISKEARIEKRLYLKHRLNHRYVITKGFRSRKWEIPCVFICVLTNYVWLLFFNNGLYFSKIPTQSTSLFTIVFLPTFLAAILSYGTHARSPKINNYSFADAYCLHLVAVNYCGADEPRTITVEKHVLQFLYEVVIDNWKLTCTLKKNAYLIWIR